MTSDNRYSHGKVYKLIDNTTGMFYIGSTALKRLDQRFSIHKKASKQELKRQAKVYQYFTHEKLCSDDVKIVLIKEEFLSNKQELLKLENEYILKEINNPLCLNTNYAVFNQEKRQRYLQNWNRTYYNEHKHEIYDHHREYIKNNIDAIKEKRKKYEELNEDKVKEMRKMAYQRRREKILAKVTCCWGSVICKHYIKEHERSQKHISFVNNQQEKTDTRI